MGGPPPSGNVVHVKWKKNGSKINYELTTKEPIVVTIVANFHQGKIKRLSVKEHAKLTLEDKVP